MSVLQVQGISKSFGGVQAVNDVSFEVGEGEICALIGPNGAGKSTCFNMLNGQLRPDRDQGYGEEVVGEGFGHFGHPLDVVF